MAERGHPRSFKTAEEYLDKVKEYIEYCKVEEQFANIAGFCVFADIHKDTYYQQREYYSDSFKKAETLLENTTLQDKNTARMIFYLKNKFNYADKQEIESKNINYNNEVSGMSEEELDRIIKGSKK